MKHNPLISSALPLWALTCVAIWGSPAAGHEQTPEPMYFDLVLGLGPNRGDVEMNTLAATRWTSGQFEPSWGPEVEFALVDDVAVELELPNVADRLDAVKFATQVTLPQFHEPILHGLQAIAERDVHTQGLEATLLYLVELHSTAGRIGRVSSLLMAGERASVTEKQWSTLINASVFSVPFDGFAVGVETNAQVFAPDWQLRIVPQVQWSVSDHFAVQAGVGTVAQRRTPLTALAALRLIVR